MTGDRSTARHARKTFALRRLLVVLATASALVAAAVVLINGVGRAGDDNEGMVTLIPTSAPTPKGSVDASPPPEGIDPTAASTSAPSPAPPGSSDPGAGAPDGPRSDDPSEPEPDDSSGGSGDPDPDREPRSNFPGGPPSDPEPSSSPDPDPSPSDDPEPSPTPRAPSPTPPDDPEPEPADACTASAQVESRWFFRWELDADMTVTNTSDTPVIGWTAAFTIPEGYRIDSADGAEVVEDGTNAVLRDTGDNAHIAPGQSVTFTFTARGSSDPAEPSDVALNGSACS